MIQAKRRRGRTELTENTTEREFTESGDDKKKQPRRRPPCWASTRSVVATWSKLRRGITEPQWGMKHRQYLVVATALCCVIFHLSFGRILWGDGCNPDGGLGGKLMDRIILFLLVRNSWNSRLTPPIETGREKISYPYVSVRRSRDQVPGYSRFLEVVLGLSKHIKETKPNRRAESEQHTRLWAATRLQVHSSPEYSGSYTGSTPRTISEILHSNDCRPGWLCYRCLLLYRDNKDQCQMACPTCYFELLCSKVHNSRYLLETGSFLQRNATSTRHTYSDTAVDSRTIPRIIHQVGPSKWLDSGRFPGLVRLQNSWRKLHNASYRYYTPELALRFVRRHFAPLENAYVSLPETEKYVLFGWMVLYHVGGVFASMNLLLESNIDVTIWNASISFAAAIRSPPSGGSCLFLWKGLVAARPEHPVVALAIQLQLETRTWSKTALSTVWDTALRTCEMPLHHESRRRPQTGGCWSSRSEIYQDFPSYVLGKAFRDVAGRSAVSVVPDDDLALFGSHATPSPKDRSLLLLMTNDDTGATRVTDVERNILIASTDLVGQSFVEFDHQSHQVLR